MCPLKTETGLKQCEDLVEVTTTLVEGDQTIEFLLQKGISGSAGR